MDLLTPDILYLVLLHWKHSRSTSTFFIFSGEIRTYISLETKNARLFQPSDLNLYKFQVVGCLHSHHYMKNPEKSFSYRLCGKSYMTEGLIWIYQNVFCRERNILEIVNKLTPKFQEGLKAYSDSPIIGEVRFCFCICWLNTYIWHGFRLFIWLRPPILKIRGEGLILGTEFTDNKSPNDPFPAGWGMISRVFVNI